MQETYTVSSTSALCVTPASGQGATCSSGDQKPLERSANEGSPKSRCASSLGSCNQSLASPQEAAEGNENLHNGGRWSKEEHEKFLMALDIYGKDWKKVQQFVGTRNTTQTRSHAQKHFVKLNQVRAISHPIEELPSGDEVRLQRSDSYLASSSATAAGTPNDSPITLPHGRPMSPSNTYLKSQLVHAPEPQLLLPPLQKLHAKRAEPEVSDTDLGPSIKRKTSALSQDILGEEEKTTWPQEKLIQSDRKLKVRAHVVQMNQAFTGRAYETTMKPSPPSLHWTSVFSTEPYVSKVIRVRPTQVEEDLFDCSELFNFAKPLDMAREPTKIVAASTTGEEQCLPYVDFTNIFGLQ